MDMMKCVAHRATMTLDEAKAELEKFVQLKTTMRPTFVDVLLKAEEVKHGRWEELYENNYKCSVCGSWWTCEETPIESGMSYCPNCGASMRSIDDEVADLPMEAYYNKDWKMDEVEE